MSSKTLEMQRWKSLTRYTHALPCITNALLQGVSIQEFKAVLKETARIFYNAT